MSAWRPSSGPAVAARRAALLERARTYFRDTHALEVDTPALSPAMNPDPAIESLRAVTGDGKTLYLQTSPEFYMKRLLAAGYPDIYSICRVFRDGEAGRRHQPEFTMLEWYRLGLGLTEIIDDTVRLIATCLDSRACADDVLRLDYATAMAELAGIDVHTASIAELAAAAGADDRLQQAIGDDRDAWLDLVLDARVLPGFDPDRLTALTHFPASKAALARLCPADPHVADRFELFLGGQELANGYVELTNPDEQRRRFEAELAIRQARGQTVGPIDACLLDALDAGLPSCAGVALGVDRLHMVYDAANDIADVVTFVTFVTRDRND